ncbi:MAG: alkyl sulfatase dimerization domain-containing protein [Roseburia sp.]
MSIQYNAERKEATEATKAYNQKLRQEWDAARFEREQEDVANAKKHLILEVKDKSIYDDEGNIIYDIEKYPIPSEQEATDTVNPYLWQITRESEFVGVYQLAEGYYAVTGPAIALIGFIRSEHGWIVVDAGDCVESAKASAQLLEKAIGEKVLGHIVAVIYSHTHWDHFGGAEAFVSQEEVGRLEDGKIPVIAPSEYEQSLVDDNLYAGVAMSRRLSYQGGMELQRDEKGTYGCGLQFNAGIRGRLSMILPNWEIDKEETIELDGVTLTFIPSPNTETRAHMCVYSNTHKVLFLGDNSMGTIHNTITPRGARVRDASFWGELYYHLYTEFGDEVQAIFQGHGIAHFKMEQRPDNLKKYLLDNAVAYKYPSDQALLLANQGVKLRDIARKIHIPDEIGKTWYTRAHYGNYTFNARGAVQRYLGFYDGNPVNLFPLEETEYAKKLVEYIGSEELILQKAESDFEKGEYQWVATIANQIVMSNPNNEKARFLCADALEQLGYQTETGLWRNMYLSGAAELRDPEIKNRGIRYMDNREVIPYVSASLLLDYLGINFDGERGIKLDEKFVLKIQNEKDESIIDESYAVSIYKGTILYEKLPEGEKKNGLTELVLKKTQLYDLASKQFYEDLNNYTAEQKRILCILEDGVVDISQYKNFNLIEPLEKRG